MEPCARLRASRVGDGSDGFVGIEARGETSRVASVAQDLSGRALRVGIGEQCGVAMLKGKHSAVLNCVRRRGVAGGARL